MTTTASILRLPAVRARVGISRAQIYLLMSQNTFPKPISLGPRAVGWIETEVTDWIEHRIQQSRQQSA